MENEKSPKAEVDGADSGAQTENAEAQLNSGESAPLEAEYGGPRGLAAL